MLRFQVLQLAEEPIVFVVSDDRLIQHMITIYMTMQFVAQFPNALSNVLAHHRRPLYSATVRR